MTAYRIFLRSGRQVIAGNAAERDRLMARKTPAAYHYEVAVRHTCSVCQRRGFWDEGWLAYRPRDLGPRVRHGDEAESVELIFCSRACWADYTGGPDLAPWVWKSITAEPLDQDRRTARWAARREDASRVSARSDYRKVPMPEWPGNKHCKWCARPIPKSSRRRSWHEDCLITYLLHSDLHQQYRFVAKRDGHVCCEPGCGETMGLEVDHDIPLWSVRDLPDDERLNFYGPENLRLRCAPCHKAKTAREAAERAAGPVTPDEG